MIRQNARESLVALGHPAVSPLSAALLESASDQVRWEAAKALGEIGDVQSIPALVKALSDNKFDVAWLVAVALSNFRISALTPLLQALLKEKWDFDLPRQRVHQVFVNQQEDGFNDLIANLIKALEAGNAKEAAMVAAFEILERMKEEVEPNSQRQ